MLKIATLTLTALLSLPAVAEDSAPPTAAQSQAEVKKAVKLEKKAKRKVLKKRAQAMRAETGPKSEGPHDNASPASENIEAGKTKASEKAGAPAVN